MRRTLLKEITYSKVLSFVISYLAIIIYESLLADLFRLGPARLDLGILLLIYVTLNSGSKNGIIFGFGLGLLLDMMTPLWLGLGSLIKATLAYGVGYFKESLFVESVFSKALLVFVAVLANDLLRYLFLYHFDLAKIGSVLIGTTLFSAAYTAAVAAIAMLLARQSNLTPQTS